MKTPIHCGKPAKGYAYVYQSGRVKHSIEHGFKCSICGCKRIEFDSNIAEFWSKYEEQLETLRQSSMAFFGENYN